MAVATIFPFRPNKADIAVAHLMREQKINIILADDHELFRDGLAGFIRRRPHLVLLDQAGNGGELLEKVLLQKPDLVITDIEMPEIDGIECTRRILERLPDMRILALSMHQEDNLILDMLDAGARGYILKNADKQELLDAIDAVMNNECWFCNNSPRHIASLLRRLPDSGKPAEKIHFTPREKEVIRLICEQRSSREIGELLHIGTRTVEGVRAALLEKMQARNTAGIVLFAIRHELF